LAHASWTHERARSSSPTQKSALSGIKYCKLDLYKFCIMSMQHRVTFSTSQHKTNGLLDLIHTDVWGPSPVASIGVANYYVIFIDDFSRKVRVYFLNQNQKYFRSSRSEKNLVENQMGRKVKILRSDNGSEYTSKEFKDYLASKGIKHQLSITG